MIKERNIAVCILLSFITCGIYSIYWFICLTDEANAAANTPGTSGGTAFLLTLVTCGIYGIFWYYKQGEKIEEAKAQRGMVQGSSQVTYLLLGLFGLGIISYALMQDSLNRMA